MEKIITLGGRIFVTTDEEIAKVLLLIRPYIVKFSDVPRLLEEHKYLFKNCDPIWHAVDTQDIINSKKKYEKNKKRI